VVTRVCVSACLSAAACPHYCTDPDVIWGSGRGCPLAVHCWADLQSVRGLRRYGNIMQMRCIAQRYNPSGPPHAARMPHTHTTHAGEDSPRDKMDTPAACAVPFRPHCGGVVERTRNVSEYMLVLALCLFAHMVTFKVT